MNETVALIDYGAGNLQSVHNALKAAGATGVVVTANPDVVARADRIVLPGVGAFGACRDALFAVPGMVEALGEAAQARAVPFLGICVGMQLLADTGEEHGVHRGLGWVPGSVRLMQPADTTVKIPHMGWNDVHAGVPHPLVEPGEAYFLHSYHFVAAHPGDILATSDHGGPIEAAVGRDNIIGLQFHPEKSQAYGLAFLARFLAWRP